MLNGNKISSRERVILALNHQEADRIPIYESPWPATIKNWERQGLSENVCIEDYFGFDFERIYLDDTPQLPEKIISQDDDFITKQDEWGATVRDNKDMSSTPELIDFDYKSYQAWKNVKDRLKFTPERLTKLKEWTKQFKNARQHQRYVAVVLWGCFEAAWHYMGPQLHLMAFVNEPEWIHEIYESHTQLAIDYIHYLKKETKLDFDGVFMWGDIAYKNGLMISPTMVNDFIVPSYSKIAEVVHDYGGKVILHGCGNMTEALPLLIDAGVDCWQAMEVKAGVDIRDLKSEYGSRISFMGNIDARLFEKNDLDGLEKEISKKVTIAKKGGGYIYHSDHSLPPETKLETFKYAIDLVKRYGSY